MPLVATFVMRLSVLRLRRDSSPQRALGRDIAAIEHFSFLFDGELRES
jgi:hypothetical protein